MFMKVSRAPWTWDMNRIEQNDVGITIFFLAAACRLAWSSRIQSGLSLGNGLFSTARATRVYLSVPACHSAGGDSATGCRFSQMANWCKRKKNKQSIKVQVAANVSKHFLDFDILSGQTCQGSFSALSKPVFPTEYSLESSRRSLHDALLFTAFKSNFFCQFLPSVC